MGGDGIPAFPPALRLVLIGPHAQAVPYYVSHVTLLVAFVKEVAHWSHGPNPYVIAAVVLVVIK